ncbi:MAG: hypothetical protein ABI954_10235 [Pyrinomonadaceae bacterium]
MFKKLLILPFALAAVVTFGSVANAAESSVVSKTASFDYSTVSSSQVRVRLVTHNVRRGRHIYRETVRVTRYRNGRVVRQVVRRVRIR